MELMEDSVIAVLDQIAPRTVDDVLDWIELIIEYPCPNVESRGAAIGRIADKLTSFIQRLDREQLTIFIGLSKECAVPLPELFSHCLRIIEEEAVEEVAQSSSARFDGRRIALYSLNEGVLRRTKEWLELRGVKVAVFNEHGGTNAMKEAARTADVFVIATYAAKHAASEFIVANRAGRPILYPAGKGSASMIRIINESFPQESIAE